MAFTDSYSKKQPEGDSDRLGHAFNVRSTGTQLRILAGLERRKRREQQTEGQEELVESAIEFTRARSLLQLPIRSLEDTLRAQWAIELCKVPDAGRESHYLIMESSNFCIVDLHKQPGLRSTSLRPLCLFSFSPTLIMVRLEELIRRSTVSSFSFAPR